MTTPTQAQIEAAAKVLNVSYENKAYATKMATAALTAAAEVGQQGYPLTDPLLRVTLNATIERCAQLAKEYIESLTDSKSETMSHWDQIRGQVETYKGSDLPRLNFESLIETIAENTETAIRALKD
ncbi:MAG TPA: hypothetical protein VIY48_02625 [Candidatus Paceibacterota bacterium]